MATRLLGTEGTMTNATRRSLVVVTTLMLGACGGSKLGGGTGGTGGTCGDVVTGYGCTGYGGFFERGGTTGTGGFGGTYATGGFGGDLGGTTGWGGEFGTGVAVPQTESTPSTLKNRSQASVAASSTSSASAASARINHRLAHRSLTA